MLALTFHLVNSKHLASLQQIPGGLCQAVEIFDLQRSLVEVGEKQENKVRLLHWPAKDESL